MDPNLTQLLEQSESHRLDFKRAELVEDGDSEKIAKHLTAFANREGGELVFGVTDDHQIEGQNFDREELLNPLSQIARSRCSPPVEFTDQYLQNQSDGESKGDILILNIDRFDSTPHAVTYGSNPTKRAYFVRTGDESRSIEESDELQQLFVGDIDPSRQTHSRIWTTHNFRDFTQIDLRPAPSYWLYLNDFYQMFTEATKEYIMQREYEEEENGNAVRQLRPATEESVFSKLFRECLPLLIFESLRGPNRLFWFEEIKDSTDFEVLKHQLPSLSTADLEFKNVARTSSEVEWNLESLTSGSVEIFTPPETTASVRFPASDDEPATLMFERDPYFSISIEMYPQGRFGHIMGTPLSYPTIAPSDSSPESIGVPYLLNIDFGFPDIEDPDIQLHEAFAAGIESFLEERWDWSNFVEDLSRREVFEILEHVKSIEEKIDSLDGDR